MLCNGNRFCHAFSKDASHSLKHALWHRIVARWISMQAVLPAGPMCGRPPGCCSCVRSAPLHNCPQDLSSVADTVQGLVDLLKGLVRKLGLVEVRPYDPAELNDELFK